MGLPSRLHSIPPILVIFNFRPFFMNQPLSEVIRVSLRFVVRQEGGQWIAEDWPFVSGASMDATATAGQSLFLFRPLTSRSATLLIMSSLNCKKPKPLGSSRPSAVWVVGVWSPNEEVQLVTSWWICFALLPNSSIVEGWSATEQTPLEVKFGWLWIICIHHFTRIAQEIVLMFADEVNGSTSWGVLLPTRSCLAGERLTHRGWSPSKTHWAWCSGVASLNKLPNPNKSQCCKAKPTLWHSQTQALRCFQFSAWKELGWIFLIFSYLLACSTVEGMPWKTLGCLCTGLWAIPMTSATTSHEAIGATWNLFFFPTSATGSMAFDFDLGKVWKVEVWAFDYACFLPHSSEALGFWFTNTSTPPSAQVSSTPIWWGVHQQRHLTWAASLPAPWPCPMSLWSIKVFCHGHVMPVWCVFGTIAAIAAIGIFRTAWSKRKQ